MMYADGSAPFSRHIRFFPPPAGGPTMQLQEES